jgi:type II secretory pathway component PulM
MHACNTIQQVPQKRHLEQQQQQYRTPKIKISNAEQLVTETRAVAAAGTTPTVGPTEVCIA